MTLNRAVGCLFVRRVDWSDCSFLKVIFSAFLLDFVSRYLFLRSKFFKPSWLLSWWKNSNLQTNSLIKNLKFQIEKTFTKHFNKIIIPIKKFYNLKNTWNKLCRNVFLVFFTLNSFAWQTYPHVALWDQTMAMPVIKSIMVYYLTLRHRRINDKFALGNIQYRVLERVKVKCEVWNGRPCVRSDTSVISRKSGFRIKPIWRPLSFSLVKVPAINPGQIVDPGKHFFVPFLEI